MMSDLDSLDREIQEKLKAVNESDQRERQVLQAHVTDLGRRHDIFSQTAAKLITDIVQPRVETLVKHFDNARLDEQRLPQQYFCPSTFTHSNRFPASVNLTIGVAHDDQIRNVVLYCDLDILPIFIKFTPHQETVLPLDQVNEVQAATWVDQRILEFLDTYLQLEQSDQYQQQMLVTDPVCGMRIRRSRVAAEQEYRGVTYFFCAERCRDQFAADPQNYVSADPA
jgi:YHS domain-containing protein